MEVEEILTPRVDVVAVEDDISLEELAQTFAESGYSRLPVVDALLGTDMERVCRKAEEAAGLPVKPCYMYALTREGRSFCNSSE